MVHSITRVIDLYGHQLSSSREFMFWAVRLFFTFGTPIFIFLSEFLLAYSYSDGVPEGFLNKRFRFIFIPYISMSFIYGVVMLLEGRQLDAPVSTTYITLVIRNLLFGFYRHGYFVLVIFQFYFIHILFNRKLNEWRPRNVLLVSLLVNSLYLGFFSFVGPDEFPLGREVWQGLSWGSFPSWIFYFALGFYSGKHYSVFKDKLKQYKKHVFALPIITLAIVMYFYATETIIINSSKRFDMIYFSTSMLFLLFYLSAYIVKIPRWAPWLSNYAFGIYLLHMFYLATMTGIIFRLDYIMISPVVMLGILFVGTTTASIFTTYLLGRLPIGVYIVGNLKIKNKSSRRVLER